MTATERVGEWMQTYSGIAFYPLDPRPEDIHEEDIAHALSLLCRYGGHVSQFYSVAEHCVLMSHAVSRDNALWALLHDATEAYMGDMVRPLKRMMPAYAEAENHLMSVLCQRFSIEPGMPDEVREADTRILLDERKRLMVAESLPWAALQGMLPLSVHVSCWSPETAKIEYLARLKELT